MLLAFVEEGAPRRLHRRGTQLSRTGFGKTIPGRPGDEETRLPATELRHRVERVTHGLLEELRVTALSRPSVDRHGRVGPRRRAVEAEKAKLRALLLELFSATELRRFIHFGPQGDTLKHQLPGLDAPSGRLATDAVEALFGAGLVDDALRDRLIEERPVREEAILEVFASLDMARQRSSGDSDGEDSHSNTLHFPVGAKRGGPTNSS